MTIQITLAPDKDGLIRKVVFTLPDLNACFNGEDGAVVMVSMDKLSRRITRDRGGMSSLIDTLDTLNEAYRQIDQGLPLALPILNSRKRCIATQLLVEAGRHPLYALRNRGADRVPVLVPCGLAQQVETELGFVDAYIDAGIATHATARERQQPNVA